MSMETLDKLLEKIPVMPTSGDVNKLASGLADPVTQQAWVELFELYNLANKGRKSMTCRPCYYMVWMWLKGEYRKQRDAKGNL